MLGNMGSPEAITGSPRFSIRRMALILHKRLHLLSIAVFVAKLPILEAGAGDAYRL